MSIAVGPQAAEDRRTLEPFGANLDALRQSEWPHADALAAAEPVTAELPELLDLPPLPATGNLFVEPGGRYDRLAELLGSLDVHQAVYVLEPDLAALAAGLRQVDLSVAITQGRLHLFAGDDLVPSALESFRSRPLSAAPDHLLTLTSDADRNAALQQRAMEIIPTLVNDAVGQLTEIGAAADPYPIARLADAVLSKQLREPTAMAHLANSLLRLGIHDPAGELIDAVIDQLGAQPELTALGESLVPGRGRVDLAARRGLLEANLAALREADPNAADRVEAAPLPDDLALFRDVNHNYQLARRAVDRWLWTPDLNDHRAAAALIRTQVGGYEQVAPNQLICGVALGAILRAACEATQRSYYDHKGAVFLVEPEPWWVRLIFHLGDFADLLAAGRIRWYLGSDASRSLIDDLRATPELNLPEYHLVLRTYHAPSAESAVRLTGELQREFTETILDRQERLGEFYAARTPTEWVELFAGRAGRPVRVLSLTTRHSTFIQHSTRDMMDAFTALGCETRMLIESDDTHAPTARYVGSQVEQFRPDLVMIIDHHRHEHKAALPAHLPFVCWIQDRLPNLLDGETAAELGRRDYTVGHCRIECCTEHGYDPETFLSLPVFTSATRYHDTPIDDAARAQYECDVSFVSHCPESHDEWFAQQLRPDMPDPLVKLMTAFFRRILAEYESGRCMHFVADLVELLREVEQDVGFAATTEPERWTLARQFWRLNDRLFRQSALEWLIGSGLDVRLYGRGWENHPTLAPFARGVAENGEQLRAIYQGSRINLQILPYGMTHQRLLDGVASGGFFLVRRHPANFCGALYRHAAEYVNAHGIASADELEQCDDPDAQELVRHLARDTELLAPAYRESMSFILKSHAGDGFRWFPDLIFEDLDAITFDSKADLLAKAGRFLADEPRRRTIAGKMRAAVLERFSFRGGMQQVLEFIRDRIDSEPPAG